MNPPHIQMPASVQGQNRLFGLDVCRTIAILLVISGHALQHSSPHPLLAAAGMVGLFGVDLFFCLSGFLIGRILIKDTTDWPADCEVSIFRFWYRRWMRTLPLYFFYFFVSLKYDWRGETSLAAQRDYLVFAQNFAWPMRDFFHLSWSLAVEEWFYLLFPVCLMVFSAAGVRMQRAVLLGAVCFVVIPAILRLSLSGSMTDVPSFDEGFRQIVIFRLDAIGAGILCAYLQVFHAEVFNRLSRFCGLFFACVIACVLATKYAYFGYSQSPFVLAVYFFISAIAFAGLLPWFCTLRGVRVEFLNRFFSFTSKISYSLYLGHIPAFMIVMWTLRKVGVFDVVYGNPWALYPLFFGCAFILSACTYMLIERVGLNYRDGKGLLYEKLQRAFNYLLGRRLSIAIAAQRVKPD